MSTARNDRLNEAVFVLGLLVGVAAVAAGVVLLVLGLSVGVREAEFFVSGRSRLLAVLGGVALVAAGVGLRAVRYRLDDGTGRQALRHGGSALAVVGTVAFLLGFSAEQTTSAPFLTSMSQKVVLIVVALGFVALGAGVVRLAGRRIGW